MYFENQHVGVRVTGPVIYISDLELQCSYAKKKKKSYFVTSILEKDNRKIFTLKLILRVN